MRGSSKLLPVVLIGLTIAAAAQAQDGRRNRQGSASSAASASNAPLPSDPVKRTWDFTKRFGIPKFAPRSDCANADPEFQQFIGAYNARVDEFLAGPSDPKKLKLERANFQRKVVGSERDIDTYRADYDEIGKRGPDSYVPPLADDMCRAKLHRYNLIAIREGLRAIGRVYPDMAEVAPLLAKANAAIARIGDDKALQAHVAGNRSGALAAVRMKPAVARNAEWEAGLRNGFVRLKPGETVLKLHLYSANWYVHKNELTSVPEYRQIGAWVATRRADGTCWINGIDLWQNYAGGGRFDGGEYKLGQAPQQILCENL